MDGVSKYPLDDHPRHQLKGCHGNISRNLWKDLKRFCVKYKGNVLLLHFCLLEIRSSSIWWMVHVNRTVYGTGASREKILEKLRTPEQNCQNSCARVKGWIFAVAWQWKASSSSRSLLSFRWLRWAPAGPRAPFPGRLRRLGARGADPGLRGSLWLRPHVNVAQPRCCWWGAALQGRPDHQGGGLILRCVQSIFLFPWSPERSGWCQQRLLPVSSISLLREEKFKFLI